MNADTLRLAESILGQLERLEMDVEDMERDALEKGESREASQWGSIYNKVHDIISRDGGEAGLRPWLAVERHKAVRP